MTKFDRVKRLNEEEFANFLILSHCILCDITDEDTMRSIVKLFEKNGNKKRIVDWLKEKEVN